MNSEKTRALLAAVKPALRAAKREWAQVQATEAPNFRCLDVLGPDENQLSEVLAELLNPQGAHGQGDIFLKSFLRLLRHTTADNLENVIVYREVRTIYIAKSRRRIDVMIDGGHWGIAIENKPWAGEQRDQFKDYAEDLEQRFGQAFVLLRLIGRDVGVTSLEPARLGQLVAQKRFATWRYESEMLHWLRECGQACRSSRVYAFLDELCRHVVGEFAGGFPDPRLAMKQKYLLPALETIFKSAPEQFQHAAAIAEMFPIIREKLVARLFDEVEKGVLKVLGPGWTAERPNEPFVETIWAAFGFHHRGWRNLYWVRLESQPTRRCVVLGVWHDFKKGIKRNRGLHQDLKRLGWGQKVDRWWDGCSTLPEPFTDWALSETIAVIRSKRKELREFLIGEFVKLCRHFQAPLTKLAKASSTLK
jgi:hypothetical protein